MTLSPTAQRMLDTLPDYYWENTITQRILEAWGAEVDRADALLDAIKTGMIPGCAEDDSLKLLSVWERILGLPVAPAGANENQRQIIIQTALRRLQATTAIDVLAMLQAQIGPAFTIARDTPSPLHDTITIAYSSGSLLGSIIARFAQRAWPCHRQLHVHNASGFVLDSGLLDTDTL